MKPLVKHLCLLSLVAAMGLCQAANAGAETTPGAPAKPAPKEVPLSGKVVETMDGGGYTYLLLKNGDQKNWVAAPLMKVKVGQELSLIPGFEMKNFTSKGLNRKFDKIVFSAGLASAETIKLSPSALKMAHQGVPALQQQAKQPAAAASSSVAPSVAASGAKIEKGTPISIERVKKAKGKNAYTVAELYAKKLKLEKKPVLVRAKVVKVTPRILKHNWIHIQDGTGTPAKKNNNLIITVKELPNVGDVVTIKGTLYNNMDFGSGYRYGVLVDGSRVR